STLRFLNGWSMCTPIVDFHHLDSCHAWHTIISVLSPLLIPNLFGAFLSAFLLGATFVGITILTTTEAKRIRPNESNKIIGYTTGVYGIGQIIGPIFTGIIAEKMQSFSLPLLVAALTLIISILLLLIGEIRCKQVEKKCI
ncbi:YbfB/YjiJ family MFS transporter, partial [Bacillus thuringiensis]